ncbi:MAG TPA: 3-deoxy-7-phosphoheptulonate synthase [Methylomusa anaerophila]|uniref:Phospho-2-dehydro-3-deoxyheptonate aldolase n=1 Tax=Methylomusa anaerophila TaxID=1930071 RepID=A0A348APH0_9FIRM|nr:3-deoxy-7-phosphoheptulonate synthase [Methylomusa anaerophila]BBB92968.1 phospho-2-dehydro-3-deoxyheptonate aldolase [Methylomusa anaerophila]HML87198.1 3-deoxy-7-phosphoheptulonate synthase [Methylomusa anaerophila]
MIIVMNAPTPDQVNRVLNKLKQHNLATYCISSGGNTIVTAKGDLSACNPELYERMPGVDRVLIVKSPFKLASREFQADDTVVAVANSTVSSFGGSRLSVIAGPCAIESYEQLYESAVGVKTAGATMLRGGAYKPRTSPYTFQGLAKNGLEILKAVKDAVKLPVVSEVTDPRNVDLMVQYVDVLQIGARNMQNFILLQEVAMANKPVLLKRGNSATIEEWLMAAEYLMAGGCSQVILCERGIRTFENYTRNTLDLNAVPVVKHLSHLPVIVDPSHGTGSWRWVGPMAKAAIACGADGLIIEVHPCPEEALSDGPQSLTLNNFTQLMDELRILSAALGRPVNT